MRRTLVLLAAMLLTQAALANEAAEGCKACHSGNLTLERWELNALSQRLKDMRDGRAEHVVPIPALSDAELEALAAALVGSEPSATAR